MTAAEFKIMFKSLFKPHEMKYILGTTGMIKRRGGSKRKVRYGNFREYDVWHHVRKDEEDFITVVKDDEEVVTKQTLVDEDL